MDTSVKVLIIIKRLRTYKCSALSFVLITFFILGLSRTNSQVWFRASGTESRRNSAVVKGRAWRRTVINLKVSAGIAGGSGHCQTLSDDFSRTTTTTTKKKTRKDVEIETIINGGVLSRPRAE